MMHSHHRPKDDPERRARALSRILDPEYTGHSPNVHSKSFGARSPSLPQASVFVDRYGEQHDPDFRPFGSYPALTPMDEPSAWPWYDDEDNDEPRSTSHGPTSFRRAHMAHSATSSSYHSSIISSGSGSTSSSAYGSRSRSASALLTPPPEPETKPMSTESHTGRNLSPPAHIPRSALFPWTPAQRAVRVQHEINKRHVLPPPFLEEEPEEVPLTLVDSRYVPGYGHFSSPGPSRPRTAPESQSERKDRQPKPVGRTRAHTAPSPTTSQPPEEEEQDEDEDEQEEQEPVSPSSHHSFRQSVYSFGLRTKLGLHHMKDRIRRASGAAKRPLSL